MKNAKLILNDIQKRLIALVDNREFRFRDTSKKDAEEYLEYLKTFEGFSDKEIEYAEQSLGIKFPTFYKEFLSQMGKQCGDLFRSYDLPGPKDFKEFKDEANEILEEDELDRLPDNTVVVLSFGGQAFTYIVADGSFDSYISSYNKGYMEINSSTTNTFADLIEFEVAGKEELHQKSLNDTGYYLSISADGYETRSYGPKANLPPILDQDDEFTD